MSDTTNTDVNEAIESFPRRKARTLRFGCGAPRSASVIGDGSRALFLRSDGPEDLVTALWMSVAAPLADPMDGRLAASAAAADDCASPVCPAEDGAVAGSDSPAASVAHREILLADPRDLLADADREDVPAEERARRERAREGGSGIVSYSVDDAGRRVVFTINGLLFLTEIDGETARTRQLAPGRIIAGNRDCTPVLNPRISPDGRHVMYTTGEHLMMVDIAEQWSDECRPAAGDAAGEPGAGDDTAMPVAGDAGVACAARAGARGRDCCGGHEAEAPAYDPASDAVSTVWSVAGDEPGCTWRIGLAEFVAGEEMDRYDGFWWSPASDGVIFETFDSSPEPVWYLSDPANPERPADGRRYPCALTRNADVRLTLANLAFDEHGRYAGAGVQQISWDRTAYEYVAAVRWSAGHEPLVLVQNRRQTKDQVLRVVTDGAGAPIGATAVLEEHANDQWIDIVPGVPAFTPDGRLVCALNDMDADTNRLTVDGRAFTPVGWQVRGVLAVSDADVLALVQRTAELAPEAPAAWVQAGDADGHDARSFDVVSFGYDGTVTPVTTEPGQWTASRGDHGLVVAGRDMTHAGARMWHNGALIADHAAEPGFTPNVTFVRLGEHRLHTAIIAPSASSRYADAETLPVLMKPYGGPGAQQVVASQSYYWDAQWWADQGFLVVTADGRGTTGRGPQWDREIFEQMKDVTLADQVEAVQTLAEAVAALNEGAAARRIPMPDLTKVCMIGWSYGGFLSALAVLDAPDVFHAGCAGAPPTDWTLYDTHYTERYLGLDPEVYRRNGIVDDAPGLRRPLMLIHGFADDNVTIAHSLRLSQALMAAGRPHTFLPLSGITHMTNDETVAQNLLTLQRDFLYDALALR